MRSLWRQNTWQRSQQLDEPRQWCPRILHLYLHLHPLVCLALPVDLGWMWHLDKMDKMRSLTGRTLGQEKSMRRWTKTQPQPVVNDKQPRREPADKGAGKAQRTGWLNKCAALIQAYRDEEWWKCDALVHKWHVLFNILLFKVYTLSLKFERFNPTNHQKQL